VKIVKNCEQHVELWILIQVSLLGYRRFTQVGSQSSTNIPKIAGCLSPFVGEGKFIKRHQVSDLVAAVINERGSIRISWN
jgi:hypothetical protein